MTATRREPDDRKPVSTLKRALIHARDGGICRFCTRNGELQLDHIVPFSHGGSDRADNLRSLCQPCNYGRGTVSTVNDTATYLPVVPNCPDCREPDLIPDRTGYVPAFCGQCGFTSANPDEIDLFERFESEVVPHRTPEEIKISYRDQIWLIPDVVDRLAR